MHNCKIITLRITVMRTCIGEHLVMDEKYIEKENWDLNWKTCYKKVYPAHLHFVYAFLPNQLARLMTCQLTLPLEKNGGDQSIIYHTFCMMKEDNSPANLLAWCKHNPLGVLLIHNKKNTQLHVSMFLSHKVHTLIESHDISFIFLHQYSQSKHTSPFGILCHSLWFHCKLLQIATENFDQLSCHCRHK